MNIETIITIVWGAAILGFLTWAVINLQKARLRD